MGRFAEQYTEDQRQAVGRAMIEQDPVRGRPLTGPEAVDALNQGRLNCPPPARPMPKTTAYWCRDRERQRQQGTSLSPLAKAVLEDPSIVRDRLAQRLISIYEHQLDRAEEQVRKGKLLDPALFRLLAQTYRDVSASAGKPHPRRNSPKIPTEPPELPPRPENVVGKLLHEHQRQARGIAA